MIRVYCHWFEIEKFWFLSYRIHHRIMKSDVINPYLDFVIFLIWLRVDIVNYDAFNLLVLHHWNIVRLLSMSNRKIL